MNDDESQESEKSVLGKRKAGSFENFEPRTKKKIVVVDKKVSGWNKLIGISASESDKDSKKEMTQQQTTLGFEKPSLVTANPILSSFKSKYPDIEVPSLSTDWSVKSNLKISSQFSFEWIDSLLNQDLTFKQNKQLSNDSIEIKQHRSVFDSFHFFSHPCELLPNPLLQRCHMDWKNQNQKKAKSVNNSISISTGSTNLPKTEEELNANYFEQRLSNW